MARTHLAIFLFGLAGLFGRGLTLAPITIVWGRALFAAASLALILLIPRRSTTPTRLPWLVLIALGFILAFHWTAFFTAIQTASVAVGLLGFASFPVFVTILEPLFFRTRIRRFDLITAALVCFGLSLMTPAFSLTNSTFIGLCWAVASGASFALLSILNRKFVANCSPLVLALGQNLSAALILTPLTVSTLTRITPAQWLWLIVLGVICTGLSHALFIAGLKKITTQLAGLIAALEPLYGIIFAAILFKEFPGPRILVGGAIIISAILLATSARTKLNPNQL